MNGLKELSQNQVHLSKTIHLTFGQNINSRATTGRPYERESSCIEIAANKFS
jgi:hypothetical protein